TVQRASVRMGGPETLPLFGRRVRKLVAVQSFDSARVRWEMKESSRVLLIAILVVSVANLLLGVLQTGLMLKQSPATATESRFERPAKYDAAVLAKVARRITEPFNRGDWDGLYAFDEAAQLQISHETFLTQVKAMDIFGKIEAAAYETARKVQS